MSSRRLPRPRPRSLVVAASFAGVLASTAPAGAREGSEGVAIDDADVVRLVTASNPTVQAAVTEVKRAVLLEEAEDRRYPFTLFFDGKAQRSAAPNLGPVGVNFPESTNFVIGSEIRKKLSLGTDISLRIEGFRQYTVTPFTFAAPGSTSPVQTLFTLGPGYGASAKFGITQPFLRGAGREVVYALYDQAKASRVASTTTRDRTASQTVLDGLTSYWELYYASRAIDIQEKSIATARQQRDDAEARVKTGSIAPVEQLTFETRLASLEEDLATLRADERRRSTALARQLGDPTLVQRRAADTAPPRRPTMTDARPRALASSPEIAEQKAAIELADLQARVASDALRPRFDVDAFVQASGLALDEVGPIFSQIGTLRALSAQVTLTYEQPLDNTRYRNEKARAELAVYVARQKLDATTQQVLADLDDAEQRERAATERIGLAERTLEIATKQVTFDQARFRTGTATALQVREAEDSRRSAELRSVRAQVDLVVAQLTISHLTGTLLRTARVRANAPSGFTP